MHCDICSHWAGDIGIMLGGHHARCPLRPELTPRPDGACHCGHTRGATGIFGCLHCGGWTLDQMAHYVSGEEE